MDLEKLFEWAFGGNFTAAENVMDSIQRFFKRYPKFRSLGMGNKDLLYIGYLYAMHEKNKYQRDWRAKNKDKCGKYLKYRELTDERREEIREYQREYYRKKAAEKKDVM